MKLILIAVVPLIAASHPVMAFDLDSISAKDIPDCGAPQAPAAADIQPPAKTNASAVITTTERAQFRSVLEKIAQSSQSRPLKFKEYVMNSPGQNEIAFSLKIDDLTQYKDAFSVYFETPGHSFSTIVAYEGVNGYTMGTLKVTKEGEKTVYEHVFDGFFDDIFTLTVAGGKIESFVYDKVNMQGISFYTLTYLP